MKLATHAHQCQHREQGQGACPACREPMAPRPATQERGGPFEILAVLKQPGTDTLMPAQFRAHYGFN